MDQIDTIERPWTKLKYGVNDRNQMCSLPNFIISNKILKIKTIIISC